MEMNITESVLVKFLADEADDQEISEINQWLSESSANLDMLTELMETYDHEYKDEKAFDLTRGISLLNGKIEMDLVDVRSIVHKSEHKNQFLFSWAKIAAAVTLIFAIGIGYFPLSDLLREPEVVMLENHNPNGQKSIMQLTDGTIVKLNSGSTFRYPEIFSNNERRVYLEGEAFFEVTKNPQMPFVVVTQDIETKVLGTSFNISAFDNNDQIVVSVATGKVKVAHKEGEHVLLLPAEKASFNKSKAKLSKSKADLEKVLAWRENILRFDAATFEEIETKLEMWYGIEVDLSKMGASDCVITGKFQNENLINVLEAISLSTEVEHMKRDNTVTFSGSCK